ncbi:hypothetical protein EJ110_NYTH43445 [Nymphaea thermarum]|nr:hypothetical protein EJ110_NYTH43445 [Nymphaea thermarum]
MVLGLVAHVLTFKRASTVQFPRASSLLTAAKLNTSLDDRDAEGWSSVLQLDETLEANGEHIRAFLNSLNVQVSWPRVQAEQMDVLAWKNARNSDISRAGHLPLDELVKRKGSQLASRCYVCKHASEDTQHLFFDCKGAKLIWAHIYGKFGRTAPWHGSPPNIKIGLNRWHTQGFKDKSLDKCWKDNFHIAIWFIWKTRNRLKHRGDIPTGKMANQFWSHCSEHWWSYQWKDSQQVKVHNWLCIDILWSNGINRGDTWVEISISSYFKAGRKGVAGLIRDTAGRFRHGLACWFPNNSVWWETEVLMECFGYLANMEDTQGSIYILTNDGDWKQHCRDLSNCRSYRRINSLFTTSLFSRAVFCKKWPLVEATNLLLLIPDNGLYTKWTPTINSWDPLKVSSFMS